MITKECRLLRNKLKKENSHFSSIIRIHIFKVLAKNCGFHFGIFSFKIYKKLCIRINVYLNNYILMGACII